MRDSNSDDGHVMLNFILAFKDMKKILLHTIATSTYSKFQGNTQLKLCMTKINKFIDKLLCTYKYLNQK